MGVFRSPREYAAALREANVASRAAMQRSAHIETERLAAIYQESAISLTSGLYSSAALAWMDHPFARRHPGSTIGKLPINRQSGLLQSSLRVVVVRVNQYAWTLRLQDDAPYAIYQLGPDDMGTSTMVPRGFWSAFVANTRIYFADQLPAELQYLAVRAALGG